MFKLLKVFLALVVAGIVLVGGVLWWYINDYALPFPKEEKIVVLNVNSGDTIRKIVSNIQALGIDIKPTFAVALFRVMNVDRNIHTGRYELKQGWSLRQLVDCLSSGQVMTSKITLVEGMTTGQLIQVLQNTSDLNSVSKTLSSDEINAVIGAPEGTYLEGWIAPDTYTFSVGIKDTEILKQAYTQQKKRLETVWNNRDSDLTLKTPYELLILASLIEKETGSEQDRKLVSSVFHNRLARGMLLQTDPSVIYGIKDFKGVILRSHLKKDTPYNTYTRVGLPPTPIANPSLKSLEAAAHPDETDYLYFVAKGQGQSHFSKSLREHNVAVQKYLRNRGK